MIEKVWSNALEEAIELLFPEIEDKDVLNTLSIYRSRINKIESEKRKGTINQEEFNLEWNKIRSSLLDTIHELDLPVKPENHEDSGGESSAEEESKEESSSIQATRKTKEDMFTKLYTNQVKVVLDSVTKNELRSCHTLICKIENDISALEQNHYFIPNSVKIMVKLEGLLKNTRETLRNKGFQNSKIDYKSQDLINKTQECLREIADIRRTKNDADANEYVKSFILTDVKFYLQSFKKEIVEHVNK